MNRARFEEVVEEELEKLPEPFAERITEIQIIVENEPSQELLEDMQMDPLRDTLFGIYEGVPLGERSIEHSAFLPDRITLFYRPLVKTFRFPTAIRREIRKTIIHEVAHFLGMDDEEIEGLGY